LKAAGASKPSFVYHAPEDMPVAEGGFRVVSLSQATLDFGRPLMETAEREGLDDKAIQVAMLLTQICWNLAVVTDDAERREARREILAKSGFEDEGLGEIIDSMIQRHHEMFPLMKAGRDRGFYIHERVIDKQEPLEIFDETSLCVSGEVLPVTEADGQLATEVRRLDDSLWKEKKELDDVQKEFESLLSRLCGAFADWSKAKGVSEETSLAFCWAAWKFIEYLYRYCGGGLTRAPQKAVAEFLGYHYLQKFSEPLSDKSTMPAALKLFARFLKEKEIAPESAGSLLSSVEEHGATFIEKLKQYHSPEGYL